MSILATFIQHSFGNPHQDNQKKRKGIQIGKEVRPVCRWHDTYYTQKILKILPEYWSLSMSLVKLQDTKLIPKTLLNSYMLTTKYQEEGLRKQFHLLSQESWASLVAHMVKSLLQCRRPGFDPWVWKILWRKKWQPIPVSHLENPNDGGAWQATLYGVAKSQKGLSN